MAEYPAGLILLVTGSSLRAEQMDRPLAYFLQTEIDKLGGHHEERLALVVGDLFYLRTKELRPLPFVSVGGPGVNRVTYKLLEKMPAVFVAEGRLFIQMDEPADECRRACVWGMDNALTKLAVATFAERYLPDFARRCWSRSA